MKIKRRELIALGILIVVLSGTLYYYLFFSDYLEERVSLYNANSQAQTDIDLELAKIGQIEQLKTDIENTEKPEELRVYELIETGDIVDRIAAACDKLISLLTISIPEPVETDGFYSVSVSITFEAHAGNIPLVLRRLNNIDICNRILVGEMSLKDEDDDPNIYSVSLTIEFLYNANKMPPPRDDKQEPTIS